jgi:YHS domain-containing protein
MYRIIIILILLTILYFLLRSAVRALQERSKTVGQNQLSDKHQMVQDPVCRVFVPRGAAVQEEIGGQIYFFCSRECAKTFQRQLAG